MGSLSSGACKSGTASISPSEPTSMNASPGGAANNRVACSLAAATSDS